MVTSCHFANFGEVGFRPPFFSPAFLMSRNPQIDRILAIIEPVCVDAGFEVVDVRLLMEQGGWVLRVCIDRPIADDADLSEVSEDRVDLSECEEVSRLLSAALDVDDPIPQAYNLEISSPGIDRPLRTAAHFRRYAGAEVKIQLAVPLATATGERRNFRGVLLGCTGEPGAEVVTVEVDGTTEFALPLEDIDSARIVPDWDDVMRGGSGVSKPKAKGGKGGKGTKAKNDAKNDAKNTAKRDAKKAKGAEPVSAEPSEEPDDEAGAEPSDELEDELPDELEDELEDELSDDLGDDFDSGEAHASPDSSPDQTPDVPSPNHR